MSNIKILNIFILLVVVIFTTSYYDRFEELEYIFQVLFWWAIIGFLALSAVMPLFNNKEDQK